MRSSSAQLCLAVSLLGGCAERPNHASDSGALLAAADETVRGTAPAAGPVAAEPAQQAPGACQVPDQPGFNHYTVAALNDIQAWPRDGAHPYCWEKRGDRCRGHWGVVHDATYTGEMLFAGGGDCYCSGHTLELFLRAYRLWQQDHGAAESAPYEVDGYQLLGGDIDLYGEYGGVFYQLWQGFGFVHEASSAAAFDAFGIGRKLPADEWGGAMPGDYVNFSRKNGTGHAVIFVSWVVRNGVRTGIRYYGCNSKGDSCPDPSDPANVAVKGGPSFHTERFSAHGGQIIPSRLYIGRPSLPTTPH